MKERLDKLLCDRGLVESRAKAAALIMAGQVTVAGQVVSKAGTNVDTQAAIELKETYPYVSRGASKLEAALDEFNVDLSGKVAADIGASTGGFTDLMLSRGVVRVYALDVGHGQLHYRLRQDARVVNLEGVNVRTLEPGLVNEPCDIITFDVSFISLKLVLPPALELLKAGGDIVALIKPQFEAGKDQVGKGGIVRDEGVIAAVLNDMQAFFTACGLTVSGIIPSPIKGAKGNQEYLIHARKGQA
ncbi:MAG: Hemolysin A [Deltaproteobacteria bacterium ADurb.Bin510]|nr:MAG: Hemolysin A [Deltaproteobacteria bacterium ADurb.Bin510]